MESLNESITSFEEIKVSLWEEKWEHFEGKNIMSREEFDYRMNFLCGVEDIEEENLSKETHFLLLEKDIRRYVHPESILCQKRKKNRHIPPELITNVAQYILMTMPEDKKLVVARGQTFLTHRD